MTAALVVAVLCAAQLGAAPVVEVSNETVKWKGRVVTALDGGKISQGDLDGHVVRTLFRASAPDLKAARLGLRSRDDFVAATVKAAVDVTWGTVARVILTVEIAGADRTEIQLNDGESQGRDQVAGPSPDATTVIALRRFARPDRPLGWPIWPTVWIERRGYTVFTHPSSRLAGGIPLRDGRLAAVFSAMREVFPREPNVTVMATEEVPFAEVLFVLGLARDAGFSRRVARPGLFR